MTSIRNFLRKHSEPVPNWLEEIKVGGAFDLDRFLESRTVYYPGLGVDFHSFEIFGLSGAVHCFIQAGYGLEMSELNVILDSPEGINFKAEDDLEERIQSFGESDLSSEELIRDCHNLSRWSEPIAYRPICRTDLTEQFREKWPDCFPASGASLQAQDAFFALGVVLEVGDRGFPEGQNYPRRIAMVFLRADGMQSDSWLFNSDSRKVPYACLLLEFMHPLRALEAVASSHASRPQWLLVAENAQPWDRYERVPELEGEVGEPFHHQKSLFQWIGSTEGSR